MKILFLSINLNLLFFILLKYVVNLFVLYGKSIR